jgi:molybdopterin-guanine dinucleotide biosynthesis protein A
MAKPRPETRQPSSTPPLYGLVLAGGAGRRLGRDKGALDYHGRPQASWAFDLLRGSCERTYVSVRPDQARHRVYTALPLIVDQSSQGPASGLLAAWGFAPDVAWLVLAADMPLIDRAILRNLVQSRDFHGLATAFRHPNGLLEPLCAIWEPAARASLGTAGEPGRVSLRKILQTSTVASLSMADPSRFRSVNTPEDDAKVRARLAAVAP